MIDYKEALNAVLDFSPALQSETIPLLQCIGRVLAIDIFADRDFPAFDRVCMDGIAIDHHAFANGRRHFKIQEIGAAGSPQKTLLSPFDAIEIMTGAPLPKGTNSVIRYEDLQKESNGFTIQIDKVTPGMNVHPQGNDINQGNKVLSKGGRIKSTDINVLATVGCHTVEVIKKPSVAIVSSGDELVSVDKIPQPYQIRRSNAPMLAARLSEHGIQATSFHLADDKEKIKLALSNILSNYDVLILSGGVSKGKFDFIPECLEELGISKCFHRVAQRPGKPFWFGRKGEKSVFAFPGNPVSTFACFHAYFVPWLRKYEGTHDAHTFPVVLNNQINFTPKLTYFAQARIVFNDQATIMATVAHGNGSGDIISPTKQDGFLVLPKEKNHFHPGEIYNFIPFHPIMK